MSTTISGVERTGTGRSQASRGIVALLFLVIPLSQIGLDIYTPALPQMAIEFAASNDLVQNTVTTYMLGMSVAFLPVGMIADALGRKRVLLSGLGLLVVASIGCALADSLTLLLGVRFVQGIGAGACLLMAATLRPTVFGAPSWSRCWGCSVQRGGRHRCWHRPSVDSWCSLGPGVWCLGCSPSWQPQLGCS